MTDTPNAAVPPFTWTAIVDELDAMGNFVKTIGKVESEAKEGWQIDKLAERHGLKPGDRNYRVTVLRGFQGTRS